MLLFLFFSQERAVFLNYEMLMFLFPDLSPGGLRSLISLLKKKHLLIGGTAGGSVGFRLSPYGEIMIQKKFPFLNKFKLAQVTSDISFSPELSEGEDHCLILGKPRSGDPHFRLLKKVLTKYRFQNIQRGIYFLRGHLPEELVELCREKYFSAVLFFSVGSWHLPNSYLYFNDFRSYSDVSIALSGISKRLSILTEKKEVNSERNHQQKSLLISVFDQIFLLLVDNILLFSITPELQTQLFSLVKQLYDCI